MSHEPQVTVNPKSMPCGASATIYTDGSCPANPGPMGIGFLIRSSAVHAGTTYAFETKCGYRLGDGTNNKAEYHALIAALRAALSQCITHVEVFTDSMLIVNQVNGKWACKDGTLKPLCEEARGLAQMFVSFKLSHVYREDNTEADVLSKNPTDTANPAAPDKAEDDERRWEKQKKPRKLSRCQAAMMKWWWETRRCRNEYRLARIFNVSPSFAGRVARHEDYRDVVEKDLPHV